jgi:hypothetical protein
MVVGALIEPDGIGARRSTPSSVVVVVKAERASEPGEGVDVEIAEGFGSRVERRVWRRWSVRGPRQTVVSQSACLVVPSLQARPDRETSAPKRF